MRELKRSSRIVEELKVGDEVIKINLNPNELLKNYRRAELDIVKAQQEIVKLQKEGVESDKISQALEVYGNAIINLFKLIFGDKNTKIILDFYEDNYAEMAEEVIPYINEVITPKIKEVAEEQKQKLRKKYKPRKKFRK